MKTFPLILFLLTVSFVPGIAQKYQNVELRAIYPIEASEQTTRLELKILVPNDLENCQGVNSLEFSILPDSFYFVGNDKYAVFLLNPPFPEGIAVKANVDICRNDYKTVSKLKQPEKLDSATRAESLSPAPYLEIDQEEIIAQARKLKGKNPVATAKKIFVFTNRHIHYTYQSKTLGALYALQTGEGDCTEFAYLMTALCRANGIPSRVVSGVRTTFGNTPQHDWVEAYLDGIGWVSFEPTTGNQSVFGTMENKYIYLSSNVHDPEGEGHYYKIRYWGPPATIKYTFVPKEN